MEVFLADESEKAGVGKRCKGARTQRLTEGLASADMGRRFGAQISSVLETGRRQKSQQHQTLDLSGVAGNGVLALLYA